jgi:hypothetical protein
MGRQAPTSPNNAAGQVEFKHTAGDSDQQQRGEL